MHSSLSALCINLHPKTNLLTFGYIRLQQNNNNTNIFPIHIAKICGILYQPTDYFIHNIHNQDSYVISNYGQSMRRLMYYRIESPEINYIYGLNVINTMKIVQDIQIQWTIIVNQMKPNNPYKPLYLGLINKSNNEINSQTEYCEYYALDIHGKAKYSSTNLFGSQPQQYKDWKSGDTIKDNDIIQIIFQKISHLYKILFVKKKQIILEYNIMDNPANYRLFIHSEQRHTLMTILSFEGKQPAS